MTNTNTNLPDMSPPVTWDTLDATTFIWRAPSPQTCEDILRLFLRHPHSHFRAYEVAKLVVSTDAAIWRGYGGHRRARVAAFDTLNWLAVNTSQLSVTEHFRSFGRAGAPMPVDRYGTPDNPLRVLRGIPTAAEVLNALPAGMREHWYGVDMYKEFNWPTIETALGRRFGRVEREAITNWICERDDILFDEKKKVFHMNPEP